MEMVGLVKSELGCWLQSVNPKSNNIITRCRLIYKAIYRFFKTLKEGIKQAWGAVLDKTLNPELLFWKQ